MFYNGPVTGNSRDSALVVRGTQLLGSFLIPHTASPPRLCLLHRVPCCSVDVEPPGLDVLIPYVFSKMPKRVRGSYASTLLSSAAFSAPVGGAFFKSVHQNRGENSTQHFKKYKDRLNYTMLK